MTSRATHTSHLLARWAHDAPQRLALLEPGGRSHTFASLHRRVRRLAGGLAEQGVGPGSRIVILLPMGIDLYEVLLGVFHAGATAVLVDPQAGLHNMQAALASVGVHGLIGVGKAHLLRLRVAALRGGDVYLSTGPSFPPARRLSRVDGAPVVAADPPPGEPALITFTTGTTGTPKAIGRSHAFLLAQHHILADHMGLRAGDVDLPTLPVFLLNSLAAGARCILPDGDLRDVSGLDPARVAGQISAHRITTISGSPAFFEPLAVWLNDAGRPAREVERIFVGGARVRPAVLEQMVAAFPAARIEVLYGSTEAEPMATIDAATVLGETAAREATDGNCVGAPVPGLDVRIVDPDDGTELTGTAVGELLVAGEHVNRSYYRNPAADAENKVHDGDRVWHRTGDAAWQDEQARLWLVGRVSARVAGLYPFVVEAHAEQVAGVDRAALIAIGGAPVVAFEGTATESMVSDVCKVDRAVRVPRIPVDRRHRAKVDRHALRALLAQM